MTKRIMILATDGFEQSELTEPKRRLEEAGFETSVVSPKSGEIKGWSHDDWGDSVQVDDTLDEVSASDFDALLLPGGQMNPASGSPAAIAGRAQGQGAAERLAAFWR